MHNQSFFVKVTIWFMVFLMSVGFVALVITPFMGSAASSAATTAARRPQELLDEARADVEQGRVHVDRSPRRRGKRATAAARSLSELGSAYRSLAAPDRTGPAGRRCPRTPSATSIAQRTPTRLRTSSTPTDEDSRQAVRGVPA